MKTKIKRCALFALMLCILAVGIFAPAKKAEAAVAFNNLLSETVACSVDSDGQLSAHMTAFGIKGTTTRIKVQLYVEKRILGLLWSKIDIGCTDDIWEDSTTSHIYENIFTTQLGSHGTYRVTVTFTVYGTGGANDVIQERRTVAY